MWPNPEETADLVTVTEGILNGKLHFLCSVNNITIQNQYIKCLTKKERDMIKRQITERQLDRHMQINWQRDS